MPLMPTLTQERPGIKFLIPGTKEDEILMEKPVDHDTLIRRDQ